MNETKKNKNRIFELDLLRGIAVFLMIFDHVMFDLWGLLPSVFEGYPGYEGGWRSLFLLSRDYWDWDVRINVRYIVVFVFLALTGICTSFSRSNVKRGLKLGALSLALSIVTIIISYITGNGDITILFGVLHCISVSLIAVGVIEKFTKSKWIYLAIGAIMVGVGMYIGVDVPYVTPSAEDMPLILLKTVLGTVMSGGDSFPLLLNGGQIFIGVFLGKLLYSERASIFSLKYNNNLITFFGRHSLPVYVIHQVAIPLILGAILLACGYRIRL